MHSAASKERPSSSSCCRTLGAGKSSILERNNNNNDILSTSFHSSLKQDSSRVFQKTESSRDPPKFDSLPPSGAARSVNKSSVVARTGNETKEKTITRQDRSTVSSIVDIKSSGPLTSAEPGRRVSSGVEMMSRFAPRPYRPASADSKVVRTRSQSVEVHSLSGARSGLSGGLEGLVGSRGRLGAVADDSRVGQVIRNSSLAADVREAPKTNVALSSSVGNTSSNKLPVAKVSSSHAPNHGSASITASAAVTRQNKDVPLANQLTQNANSLARGSQGKGENLVKSNCKVPTMIPTTMNSAGISLGPKSSDTAPSSTKSGGFTMSTDARHSHSLPPQQTNSHTVTATSSKATSSVASKTTNDKKTSSSAGSNKTVSSIPPNAATRSSNETTSTTAVHSLSVVSCKESSLGQTTKSSDVLLKGHPRDTSLVPSESPTKLGTSTNDRGAVSMLTNGSNSNVKHRAVIKSGPEALLFSNGSFPGPVSSQKLPKDSISTMGSNLVGLNKTATDGTSVKTSVALENASISASRYTSSVSSPASYSRAASLGSDNSSTSNKPKKNDETKSSSVPPSSSSSVQINSATSSKSSLSSPSTTSLNSVSDSTLTSLSPNSGDYQKSPSPESPISPTDSLIIVDSPVSQPSDPQRKLNAPTGLRLNTKIDTSNDSVSSALSVLMKRQSASGNIVPASPKCSYRYGSRGAISSIYQNKLGSGASSQYNKNMSDLYGDFFRNMKDCRSLVKDAGDPSLEARSQQEQISTSKSASFSAEPKSGKTVEIKPSAKDDSSLPVSHGDQISLNLYLCPTERRSRCNAPQPIRRVLSCDSATSPQVRVRSPLLAASETRRLFFEGTAGATVRPDEAQVNGIDRSPSPNTPFDPPLDAQTSFIDDPGADSASEAGVVTVRATLKRSKRKQRVSFEPVSLLLNAALEGELDIVKVTIPKVRDAMVSNESGVTALHNSVFSGHHDVCRFLIDYGCTVNITDADGWTPLHCAASCNNVEMVKLLVQNGACLFAMTFNDRQIPVDKCNRQLPGYDDCRKYLSEQTQAIGVANGGVVYATVDCCATGTDELSFRETDQLRVIRKGDEAEMEWWWAKPVNQPNKQGYIPRNYLSMYPAKPKLTVKN